MIKYYIKKAIMTIIALLAVISVIFRKILVENYNINIIFFVTIFVLVIFINNVLIPLFTKETNNTAKYTKIVFNITSIIFAVITFLSFDMVYIFVTLITAIISLIIDAIYLKHIDFIFILLNISIIYISARHRT